MAQDKRAKLLKFLMDNRRWKCDTNAARVRKSFKLLEPLFEIAGSGKYELSPPAGNFDKAARAIWLATGTEANGDRIIPVQASRLIERPEWMSSKVSHEFWSEHRMRDDLWAAVNASIQITLEDYLYANRRKPLDKGLESSVTTKLESVLMKTLITDLVNSLEKSTGTRSTTSLRSSVFFFLGCAMSGHGAGADNMSHIIKLLPDAVPLGERPDGKWLVLFK